MADAAGEINQFLTGIADFATQNLIRKNRAAEERTIGLAQELASTGQLGGLTPDMQKSVMKAVGKENFGLLEFQSNLAAQRAAPAETLRQGAISQLRAPVQELVGEEEGPGPVTEEGLPAEGPGAPQPLFQERAPTPQEQFGRLDELGPVGTALVGGPALGQLSAQQAQLGLSATARSFKEKQAGQQFVMALAKQGRRVLQPVPVAAVNRETIPRGFYPYTIGDQVWMVQSKKEDFDINADAELRFRAMTGKLDARDMTQKEAMEIKRAQLDDEVAVSAAQGRESAKTKINQFWKSPLNFNRTDHGFFDKATGERLSGYAVEEDVAKAAKAGQVVELNGKARDQLLQLKKGVTTFNRLAGHIKAVYGPGGILENLQSRGRLGAGIQATFADVMQSDPEFSIAKRVIDSMLVGIGREFQGASGTQTELDVKKIGGAIAQMGLIPDSADVAFGLLETMREGIVGAGGAILETGKWEPDNLLPVRDIPAKFETPEGNLAAQPVNMTPKEAEALFTQIAPGQVDEYKALMEKHPEWTQAEWQRVITLNSLPEELKQALVSGQITADEAMEAAAELAQQQQQQ